MQKMNGFDNYPITLGGYQMLVFQQQDRRAVRHVDTLIDIGTARLFWVALDAGNGTVETV
ncbi:MAG: hypothetical protein V7752_19510 [Halopseudomonas sp.]